ncbi:DUF2818 family protein [Paracidovorax wautersii]|uniref:DUF2818 family protein n=1 Tax=Paracidovorax wautersii TaxID=1177982 RepID=UPI0031D4D134
MSPTGAIWLVIVAALLAANLPFMNQRWFAIGPAAPAAVGKPLIGRVVEMVVLYFLVGGFALMLEKRAGQIAPQGWEFYAVTATLFLTLAFPGFVYRYLLKRRG